MKETDGKNQFSTVETINLYASAKPDAISPKGELIVDVDGKQTRVVSIEDSKTKDLLIFSSGNNEGVLNRMKYRIATIDGAVKGASVNSLGSGNAKAPMPGKVVKVAVVDGQQVKKGSPLIILEAMKMEHVVTAAKSGTVTEITASVGDQVDDSKILCKIV